MSQHERIIISWLGLRRMIGVLGIAHPVVLYLGGIWLFSTPLQSSMSAYYYTGMRDVFVGLGFVTGAFLLAYNGYDKRDRIISLIAGVMAIITALLPMAPADGRTKLAVIFEYTHVGCAFIFLLALAYFCLAQFPKSASTEMTDKKRKRNRVYKASGWTLIAAMGIVATYFLYKPLQPVLAPYNPIFFGELVAFWAFGIAWLVKGEALLADD